MKPKPRYSVGDKICYNAFGQRKKTLGMVLAFERIDSVEARWKGAQHYEIGQGGIWMVFVQWWKTGNVMPKRWKRPSSEHPIIEMPICGSIVWHEVGPWFEVIE